MRAYLTAHAAKQHEKHFGWKTFRVLTVTTDQHRMQSMMEALRKLRIPHSPGAPLFFFTTRDELRTAHAGRTVLAVTHLTPIKMLLQGVPDLPMDGLFVWGQ